jgi:hypothetical protein
MQYVLFVCLLQFEKNIHIQDCAIFRVLYNSEHQQTCVRVTSSLVNSETTVRKQSPLQRISESQDIVSHFQCENFMTETAMWV